MNNLNTPENPDVMNLHQFVSLDILHESHSATIDLESCTQGEKEIILQLLEEHNYTIAFETGEIATISKEIY